MKFESKPTKGIISDIDWLAEGWGDDNTIAGAHWVLPLKNFNIGGSPELWKFKMTVAGLVNNWRQKGSPKNFYCDSAPMEKS